MAEKVFTKNWFEGQRRIWDNFIPKESPKRILEVGSYEGASACYIIEKLGDVHSLEIHCVDTWSGGIEHQAGGSAQSDMQSVEGRFHNNINVAKQAASQPVELVIHKGYSDFQLAKLLSEGKADYFDFIYIDGSHQAPDVLADAILGFRLLKVGGVMAFDDYLWFEPLPYGQDLVRSPKIAIDAFVNIYCRKLRIMPGGVQQLYIRKLAD